MGHQTCAAIVPIARSTVQLVFKMVGAGQPRCAAFAATDLPGAQAQALIVGIIA
jgi:hypothetical protein